MAAISFLDGSALVKIALPEAESHALDTNLINRDALFTSRVATVELWRAVARSAIERGSERRDEALEALFLVDLTDDILEHARTLEPPELRTLDAIHLATALSMNEPELEFVTYDHRLMRAAEAAGLTVVHPGMPPPPTPAPRARR